MYICALIEEKQIIIFVNKVKRRKHFSIFLIVLFCFNIFVSEVQGNSDTYHYSTYSRTDGLSHNTVRSIIQDHKGLIWAGTSRGVNFFDGTSFHEIASSENRDYSFNDKEVREITEDTNGFLWIKTDEERYCCFDPKTNQYVKYVRENTFKNHYNQLLNTANGDIWLWGGEDGCLKVSYKNGTFGGDSVLLSGETVSLVQQSPDLGIVILSDCGIFINNNDSLESIYDNQSKLRIVNCIETVDNLFFFTLDKVLLVYNKKSRNLLASIDLPSEIKKGSEISVVRFSSDKILLSANDALYFLDIDTYRFTRAEYYFGEKEMLQVHIYSDNKNNIWVYDDKGFIWLSYEGGTRMRKLDLMPNKEALSQKLKYKFLTDSRGLMWVTTYGNGLYYYIPEEDRLINLQTRVGCINTICSNDLLSIMEDRSGVIWVGTEFNGITCIEVPKYKLKSIFPESQDLLKRSNSVDVVVEDLDRNLWVGNALGNLYIYNKEMEKIQTIEDRVKWTCSSVAQDGSVWLGTEENGLKVYRNRQAHPFSFGEEELLSAGVQSLLCDKQNRMWIGMNGTGLNVAIAEKDSYTFRSLLKEKGNIHCMTMDRLGSIWAGGDDALYVFQPDSLLKDSSQYRSIPYSEFDERELRDKRACALIEDKYGQLWVGYEDGGLVCYVQRSEDGPMYVESYTLQNGLANNSVKAIVEDDFGTLWISTDYGVSRFNPESKFFENYFFADINLGNIYNPSAGMRKRDGDILFGSMYGCYQLNPRSFYKNNYAPPVVITRMQVNGEPFLPDKAVSKTPPNMCYTSEVELDYGENVLTFDYLLPNYNDDHSNLFSYKMEGFDKQWSSSSYHNQAIYRYLPPGKYVLKVKGCNSAGVWTPKETQLSIKIRSPWYRSFFAVILYILLLLLIVEGVYGLVSWIRFLNKAVKKEKNLVNYKIHFFSKMSIELKNAIHSIQKIAQKLSKEPYLRDDVKKQLLFVEDIGDQTLEMLDILFGKDEGASLKLNLALVKADVMPLLRESFRQFEYLTHSKGIMFSPQLSSEAVDLPFDRIKLEKILYCMQIAMFEYASLSSKIVLETKLDEKYFHVVLFNDDSTFPLEELDTIEKNIDRLKKLSNPFEEGFVLFFKLLFAHHALFEYHRDKGVCFKLSLLIKEEEYASSDFVKNTIQEVAQEPLYLLSNDNEKLKSLSFDFSEKKTLMIIEDKEDLVELFKKQFESYFTIIVAQSGSEGLQILKEIQEKPSLVLCASVLHDMSGYKVTRKIKNDFQTCYIPVLLLLEKESVDEQILCLDSGADSFAFKPFSIQYLLLRIVKLIEHNERLKLRFSEKQGVESLPSISTTNRDKVFMDEVNMILNKNIENSEFSISDLVDTMKIGRTVFYKKLKQLTGCSPNEYIRMIRINAAVDLLKTTNLSVSEVCYKVGFNDPLYFSKCFKKQYGMSPSALKK